MHRRICSGRHHASGCGKNKNHVGKGKCKLMKCGHNRRGDVLAPGSWVHQVGNSAARSVRWQCFSAAFPTDGVEAGRAPGPRP